MRGEAVRAMRLASVTVAAVILPVAAVIVASAVAMTPETALALLLPNNTLSASAVQIATQIPTFLCPSDIALQGPRTNAADLSGNIGQTNYKGVSGANWAWGNAAWNPGYQSSAPDQNGLANGNGMFYRGDGRNKVTLVSVNDGLSNTLMIGEDIPSMNQWCSWPYSNNAVGTCAIKLNNGLKSTDPGYNSPGDWPNVYSFRSRHTGGANFAMGDGSVRFLRDSIDINQYRFASTTRGGEVINLD